MASSSFGNEKRLSGKAYRTGEMGAILTDVYGDIDRAFVQLEKAVGYAPVKLATTGALSPANTYSEATGTGVLTAAGVGTLTVDGVLTALGDRILVKDEAAKLKRGIYEVTTAGAAGAAYVLTRVSDLNEQDDVTINRTVLVTAGTANGGSTFRMSVAPATLGTNDMEWAIVAAGSGLTDAYFTAARMKANGAGGGKWDTDAIDLTDADQLDAWKANGIDATAAAKVIASNAIAASKLEAGAAAAGINSGDAQFSTLISTSGSFAPTNSAPLFVQELTIGAAGTYTFTNTDKIKVLGFEFISTTTGDATATIKLVNKTGNVDITDTITQQNNGAGTVNFAGRIDPASAVVGAGVGVDVISADNGGTAVAGVAVVKFVPVV